MKTPMLTSILLLSILMLSAFRTQDSEAAAPEYKYKCIKCGLILTYSRPITTVCPVDKGSVTRVW